MSCMRRCEFYLATDGQWYVSLGNFEYAYDDCDCTEYGPFDKLGDAETYVRSNHTNPGQSETNYSGTVQPPKSPIRGRRF